MKYNIFLLPEAQAEKNKLAKTYQDEIENAYKLIEEKGTEFVFVNSLGNKLYEIKTDKTRSVYKYNAGQIIIVGLVFLKKSQKAPKQIIKLAQKRLNKEI